jgi:hypothetical protein
MAGASYGRRDVPVGLGAAVNRWAPGAACSLSVTRALVAMVNVEWQSKPPDRLNRSRPEGEQLGVRGECRQDSRIVFAASTIS